LDFSLQKSENVYSEMCPPPADSKVKEGENYNLPVADESAFGMAESQTHRLGASAICE